MLIPLGMKRPRTVVPIHVLVVENQQRYQAYKLPQDNVSGKGDISSFRLLPCKQDRYKYGHRIGLVQGMVRSHIAFTGSGSDYVFNFPLKAINLY